MKRRYAEHFDCPLHFDARDNAFAFDKRWLDQPLPLADVITHQAMAERCRKQNTEFTGRQAWLGRIRQLLSAQLNAAPGLEGLAEQMNCSARTLRRHLKDLGCSYQELLDELRFEQAKQMLCEDQTADLSDCRGAGLQRDREFSSCVCALERCGAESVPAHDNLWERLATFPQVAPARQRGPAH